MIMEREQSFSFARALGKFSAACTVLAHVATSTSALACTTVATVPIGAAGPVIAKSFDWDNRDGLVFVNQTNVTKSAGKVEGPAAEWISRNYSVTFNQFGRDWPMGGMNNYGIVVEIMKFAPKKKNDAGKWVPKNNLPANGSGSKNINIFQWIQFILDRARDLDDVESLAKSVTVSNKITFKIFEWSVTDFALSSGSDSNEVHYIVCDKTGQCKVIEYNDGHLWVSPAYKWGENGKVIYGSLNTPIKYAYPPQYQPEWQMENVPLVPACANSAYPASVTCYDAAMNYAAALSKLPKDSVQPKQPSFPSRPNPGLNPVRPKLPDFTSRSNANSEFEFKLPPGAIQRPPSPKPQSPEDVAEYYKNRMEEQCEARDANSKHRFYTAADLARTGADHMKSEFRDDVARAKNFGFDLLSTEPVLDKTTVWQIVYLPNKKKLWWRTVHKKKKANQKETYPKNLFDISKIYEMNLHDFEASNLVDCKTAKRQNVYDILGTVSKGLGLKDNGPGRKIDWDWKVNWEAVKRNVLNSRGVGIVLDQLYSCSADNETCRKNFEAWKKCKSQDGCERKSLPLALPTPYAVADAVGKIYTDDQTSSVNYTCKK